MPIEKQRTETRNASTEKSTSSTKILLKPTCQERNLEVDRESPKRTSNDYRIKMNLQVNAKYRWLATRYTLQSMRKHCTELRQR